MSIKIIRTKNLLYTSQYSGILFLSGKEETIKEFNESVEKIREFYKAYSLHYLLGFALKNSENLREFYEFFQGNQGIVR